MISVLLFLLLLFLSAILSGSESAIFSLPEASRERFTKSEKLRGQWILKWLYFPNRTLAAILLGNLAVNTLLSLTGDSLVKTWFSGQELRLSLISLFSITLIILIVAEIIPKVIAIQFSEAWVLFWSPFLKLWFMLADILARPLDAVARWFNRFGQSDTTVSERDLVKAIRMAGQHGVLHDEEQNILRRSVNFLYDTAYHAMLPLSQSMMLPHSASFLKAKKVFLQQKQPIALIYHEKQNQVIGYLHVRDLVRGIYKKQRSLKSKTHEMIFVPETMLLKDVLQQFTSQTSEVAGVVDESGQLTGIITLKDVLAEIIGEWDEEYQKRDESEFKLIQKISKNSFHVLGELEVDEFNEYFRCHLQARESETMSGFLIEEIDGFPQKDTSLLLDGFEFSNMEVSDYKIKRFKMSVKK